MSTYRVREQRVTGRFVRAVVTMCAAAAVAATFLPAAGTAAPPHTSVDWQPCEDAPHDDCGTLRVPLDYARPDGATIGLAMERRPADDPAHRIGTVFVDPGGPGVSGLAQARDAADRFDAAVLARFDVVGFDPRGVGSSTPLQCFDSNADAAAVIGDVQDVPIGHAEVGHALSALRTYTTACGERGRPIVAHMSTLDVARDLDAMRRAVGDDRLTYAGYSYGTLIGATYANLYPDRVRAMVLDGPVDPYARTHHRIANKLARADGFEHALDAMLDACQDAGSACPLYGGGVPPRQKFDRLRERLRAGPLGAGADEVTISTFTDGLSTALEYRSELAPVATQIQQLYASAFGDARAPARVPLLTAHADASGYGYNVLDAYWGVNCVDAPMPRDRSLYPALANAFETRDRTFGRWEVFNEAACATWPVVTDERYAGPWHRRTPAPVLVVGQTLDPATPYPMAEAMTAELGRARLLTVAGFGHTSQDSACAARVRDGYLVTGRLPAGELRCRQDVPPFPG